MEGCAQVATRGGDLVPATRHPERDRAVDPEGLQKEHITTGGTKILSDHYCTTVRQGVGHVGSIMGAVILSSTKFLLTGAMN